MIWYSRSLSPRNLVRNNLAARSEVLVPTQIQVDPSAESLCITEYIVVVILGLLLNHLFYILYSQTQQLSTILEIKSHTRKEPYSGVYSKYTMRVEYYTHNNRYSLVVDGRLILYTSSKPIADYYYARALKHTSSSSELYSIPISPPYTSSWCSCSSKRTIVRVEPILVY